MIPMVPNLALDLGSDALRFGWTLDGTALALLVTLLIPWIVLGLAVIVGVLDRSRRPTATTLAEATSTEATVAEAAVPTRAEFPQAA